MTIKERVRRWLGLDGPGGLADVLAVKDNRLKSLEESRERHDRLFKQAIPVLNDNTISLQRLSVYEQQVPSIARVFRAMRDRAVREQRKKEAERALAAPPTELPPRAPAFPPEAAPPQDAVLDDVSAEVGGG